MDARAKVFNEVFKMAILKPVENTNKYTPKHGVTDTDREKFFNNYNQPLNKRIVDIKLNRL